MNATHLQSQYHKFCGTSKDTSEQTTNVHRQTKNVASVNLKTFEELLND